METYEIRVMERKDPIQVRYFDKGESAPVELKFETKSLYPIETYRGFGLYDYHGEYWVEATPLVKAFNPYKTFDIELARVVLRAWGDTFGPPRPSSQLKTRWA